MLQNFFAEGKKCVLKFIARLDKNINFKNFNIRFNMHHLNPDTLQSRPLAAMDSIDDMIKVFHKQVTILDNRDIHSAHHYSLISCSGINSTL